MIVEIHWCKSQILDRLGKKEESLENLDYVAQLVEDKLSKNHPLYIQSL